MQVKSQHLEETIGQSLNMETLQLNFLFQFTKLSVTVHLFQMVGVTVEDFFLGVYMVYTELATLICV